MLIDLVLLATALICAGAVVYPFLIYPAILRLASERPVDAGGGEGERPSASLLFCAYNEGAVMAEKIANLEMLKARHPELEILAFDDGSSDDTADQLAARPDLLTLVRGSRSGKAHGMKRLAAMATGEVLIFTDANVMLDEDAVGNCLDALMAVHIGGVLGSLRYLDTSDSAAASVGSLYWRIEERLKDLESRSGNVMGADGSIFSIRRSLYPDFPDTVLDDLTVSMAVVFAGKRLIKATNVIAYERPVAKRSDEYRRKVRISARAWHTHGYLRPQLRAMTAFDRFKYGSRKIVRWFGGLFLIVGALAALALAFRIAPWLGGAMLAGGAVLAWLGLRAQSGPLASVADIVLAYFATLQGVFQAMRGKTFVVWAPAKSR